MTGKYVLDYDSMMEEAMRGMVVYALKKFQEGVIGDEGFLVVIDTKHKGVILPNNLKKRIKSVMVILIQNDRDGIVVGDNYFSIIHPDKLTIPFDAILSFYDKEADVEIAFDDSYATEIEKNFKAALNKKKSSKKKEKHPDEDSDFLDNLIDFNDIKKRI
jgi:hypothetical protein